MPPRILRDEVMTSFLAGHDTTAVALSWMWLLLGSHRDVDFRLQAELSSVLDGRIPMGEDLEHLPYSHGREGNPVVVPANQPDRTAATARCRPEYLDTAP